jgi:hypothetical protein
MRPQLGLPFAVNRPSTDLLAVGGFRHFVRSYNEIGDGVRHQPARVSSETLRPDDSYYLPNRSF